MVGPTPGEPAAGSPERSGSPDGRDEYATDGRTERFEPIGPAGDHGALPPAPMGGGPGGRLTLRNGILAAASVIVIAGLVGWLVSGTGGGGGGHEQNAGSSAAGGLPGASAQPTSTRTRKPKGSKSKSSYLPYAQYTPGAVPAAAPAASLPGVSGPDPTVACPGATVTVGTAAQLTQALSSAVPGAVIRLSDGTYSGKFTATAAGTAARPIFLCGDSGAVLDGGSTTASGYALHLTGANYWRLDGFTIQDGQKGLVLDHSDNVVVEHLTVQNIGDEAVHLREFSDDDLVLDNTIRQTGSLDPKFGEGVYIGTAKSNWCTYTFCEPDQSDNDVVRGNTISATTAESVDIKEGTTGGALIDNNLDGAGLSPKGASGWVNAKGNDYLIKGNVGRSSYQDGFQTHQILSGWGMDNVFEGNTAIVNGTGYGFHFTPVNGNVWTCDNKVEGAARGQSNIPCVASAP